MNNDGCNEFELDFRFLVHRVHFVDLQLNEQVELKTPTKHENTIGEQMRKMEEEKNIVRSK